MMVFYSCDEKLPEYIEGTNRTRDLIIDVFRGSMVKGYYQERQWYDASGNNVKVIGWLEYPLKYNSLK